MRLDILIALAVLSLALFEMLSAEEKVPALFDMDYTDESVQFTRKIRSDDIEARRRSLDKNFMRFGRVPKEDSGGRRFERELIKRNNRVGKDGKNAGNLMRFGRADNNNFMRFGRNKQQLPENPELVENDPLDDIQQLVAKKNNFNTGKRENLMRFGRNFMRFGRGGEDNRIKNYLLRQIEDDSPEKYTLD